jgi:hypothetical protein
MTAECTLAADCYEMSTEAEVLFTKIGVGLGKVYSQRTFYGKQGEKNHFIYAHAVSAPILRAELPLTR